MHGLQGMRPRPLRDGLSARQCESGQGKGQHCHRGRHQGQLTGVAQTPFRLVDDDAEHIEGNSDKIKGLVLKTCFLKKA